MKIADEEIKKKIKRLMELSGETAEIIDNLPYPVGKLVVEVYDGRKYNMIHYGLHENFKLD
jgi:hypothetical protein